MWGREHRQFPVPVIYCDRGDSLNPLWRIELLGWLRLVGDDRVIDRFRTQKVASLLAYLAYHSHRSHPREELIELLWPGGSPETSRRSLRVALVSLRRQLEPPEMPPGTVLIADRAAVRLNPAVCVTDVARFEAAVEGAARADGLPVKTRRLTEAAQFYRGDLLPGYFDDWIHAERQRLVEAHLVVLDELAAACEAAGDWHGAIQWARRAVGADPLREEAHQRLIHLLAAAGQPETALRQYRDLERLLRVELRAAPEAALRVLARELEAQIAAAHLADLPAAVAEAPAVLARPSAVPPINPAPPADPAATGAATDTPVSLPPQFTRFFGREIEIGRLEALLMERSPALRLVTLTGPGGTGKTRLAQEAAARVRERFDGRIAFVPLVDLTEPGLIAGQILDALRVPRSPSVPPLEQAIGALSATGGRTLLLLDNFEHLLPDGAVVVQALLERVERLSLWVTSRQILALPGEQEMPVAPLPTPVTDGGGLGTGCGALDTVPSVALFVDRAQSVRADFQLTRANTAIVARLCAGLEGIPLAIELAAARSGVLSPAQMLERLRERFELLTTRRRMPDRRHQSLWAALEWSYQLLSPALQQFFAWLSVFQGGWTLEAAEAVCGGEGAGWWALGSGSDPSDLSSPTPSPASRVPAQLLTPTLDLLQQLRESSLVLAEEGPGGMRYRLLETMREFGAEKLPGEERLRVAQRHAAYFLALAETADPKLRSAERLPWAAVLDQEHDNIRAALTWSLAEADGAARGLGLRLAAETGFYWHFRCHWSEGRRWLESVLALPEFSRVDPHAPQLQAARAKALDGAAFLAWHEGDNATARAQGEASVALWRRLGNKAGLATALMRLSKWILDAGDRASAIPVCREAVALWREVGDEWHLAWSLTALADTLLQPGQTAAARGLMEEALGLSQRTGDRLWIGLSLEWLAGIALEEGDVHQARALHQESSAYHRTMDSPFEFGTQLIGRGAVLRYQGDYEEAKSVFEEALSLQQFMGQSHGIARCLNELGLVALAQGDMAAARARFEEALALLRSRTQRYQKMGLAFSLGNLGRLALALEDFETAIPLLEESLALWRELARPRAVADALGALGNAALGRGDLAAARALHEESLARRQAIPDRLGLGDSFYQMARVSQEEGDADAALAFFRESLAFRSDRGDRRGVAECLEGLARLAVTRREPERAVLLWGAAESLREEIGAPVPPCDRDIVHRSIDAARTALGEASFTAEWARGRAIPLEPFVASLLER